MRFSENTRIAERKTAGALISRSSVVVPYFGKNIALAAASAAIGAANAIPNAMLQPFLYVASSERMFGQPVRRKMYPHVLAPNAR